MAIPNVKMMQVNVFELTGCNGMQAEKHSNACMPRKRTTVKVWNLGVRCDRELWGHICYIINIGNKLATHYDILVTICKTLLVWNVNSIPNHGTVLRENVRSLCGAPDQLHRIIGACFLYCFLIPFLPHRKCVYVSKRPVVISGVIDKYEYIWRLLAGK